MAEALEALRRAVLEPDSLPRKVVARAVVAAAPDGPSAHELEAWHTAPAGGATARAVADLSLGALQGLLDTRVAARVERRYGAAGLIAAVSIAALLRVEDPGAPGAGPAVAYPLARGGPLAGDTAEVGVQIRRSFGQVPPPWRLLALEPRALPRWWQLHEAALVPGALSGEEKWLVVVTAGRALGAEWLASPYRTLLVAQGWRAGELDAAAQGQAGRLRPGMAGALPAAQQAATGAMDGARFRVRAAGLPPGAVDEMLDVVALARGLATFAVLL